jgi:pimeloyl-ACP methyl ester carboxylesterase
MRVLAKRILIGLGSLVTVLAIGEAIVRQQVSQQYPALGKMVDIGGRRIQLDCRGMGSPTVVLEAGLGNLGSLSWSAVQDSIATTTRVCSYSRAGIMWSDPAPGDFDSQRMAQDLHNALTNAGEQTPWVMVGHSLGGPHVMIFNSLYESEIVGFVFVDASHPDQNDRFRKIIGSAADDEPKIAKIPPLLADVAARIGIVRLLPLGSAPDNAPSFVAQTANAYLPQTTASNLQAVRSFKTVLTDASKLRKLGDRPLIVLTATQKTNPEELKKSGMSEEKERAFQTAWEELHKDQATWSSRSRHQIVESSHNIQFDRPDVVINAVNEVVAIVRKQSR